MTPPALWFRFADVLDLAEHAMSSPDHQHDPYDESSTGTPALIWVKDDGIYLASNGLPHQAPTQADPAANIMHAVYARDHGPGTHWHHGPPLRHDFVEYLPLTDSFADDGTSLIESLRSDPTATWLVITVFPDTFAVDLVVDTDPP